MVVEFSTPKLFSKAIRNPNFATIDTATEKMQKRKRRPHTERKVGQFPVPSPLETKNNFYYDLLTCHASAPAMAKVRKTTITITSHTQHISLQPLINMPIFTIPSDNINTAQ